MRIFVTVGTTRFDSLIAYIADEPFFKEHECTLQVGPSGLRPDGFDSFEYTDKIDNYYNQADVIVSHAGAGSIYQLLGLKKSIVIVPNTERLDQHQTDIAHFMDSQGYALSIDKMGDLVKAVQKASQKELRPFERDAFFAVDDILDFLNS